LNSNLLLVLVISSRVAGRNPAHNGKDFSLSLEMTNYRNSLSDRQIKTKNFASFALFAVQLSVFGLALPRFWFYLASLWRAW
jgi:hypothetical protein